MTNLLDIKESKAFAEFVPILPGRYDAVLVGVIQLGSHMQSYQGKDTGAKTELTLLFEIPELKDSSGVARSITKTIPVPGTINAKSNFYKIFKAMKLIEEPTVDSVSKVFGTKESLENILGTTVSLDITNYERNNGETGHAIDKNGINKLDSRLPQPTATVEPFVFTFKHPDISVFKNRLTHYNRSRIMEALNANELPKEFHEAFILELEERTRKQEEYKKKQAKDVI